MYYLENLFQAEFLTKYQKFPSTLCLKNWGKYNTINSTYAVEKNGH